MTGKNVFKKVQKRDIRKMSKIEKRYSTKKMESLGWT